MLLYPTTDEGTGFSLEARPFINLASPRVSIDVIRKLEARVLPSSRLTEAALRESGLNVRFNEQALELHVEVPLELKALSVVYMSRRGDAPHHDDALRPSPLSGFINAQAGQDFNVNVDPGTKERRPLRTDLDGALNYRNWVIEGNSSYTERAENNWSRGDVRVVRDFPNAMVRGAIGDLSYPVSYYQRFRPLGGITAASNFSLQPYRVTIPMSSTEIFLRSPSRVIVSANGARIQTLQLPAGRHDLRNLALSNGISDIRLDITDEVGRTETIVLPWVSDSDLLAKDVQQFAYSAGFPSQPLHGSRRYEGDRPTASLFHRYGITDHVTSGGFFQGDRRQIVAGLEALWARWFGTLALEPAISRLSQHSPTFAGRVRYSLTDYRGPDRTQRNFAIGVEHRERGFAFLDDVTGAQTLAYDLNASYGQTLFLDLNARLNLSYQFNRRSESSVSDTYGTSFTLLRSFDSGIQASVTLTDRRNVLGVKERGVFALFSWAIPATNHYLTASTDTSRDSNRLDWRYNSPRLVGGFNVGAGVEKIEAITKADATVEYVGNRGTIALNQDTQHDSRAKTSHVSSIRAGTALVFAGGKFAVGRPVSDSFAIVAPINGLKGQTVDVNPNSYEYYDARADWLGPGVIPNMRPYQYFHLYFDPSKLDPGYELGQENFHLLPTYKSGVLIALDNDSKVMLGGWLRDKTGQPLALASGEARALDDSTSTPVTLFTNRKGKFRILGFKPGRYELRFFNEKYQPVRFEIPPGTTGLYDIGGLSVANDE